MKWCMCNGREPLVRYLEPGFKVGESLKRFGFMRETKGWNLSRAMQGKGFGLDLWTGKHAVRSGSCVYRGHTRRTWSKPRACLFLFVLGPASTSKNRCCRHGTVRSTTKKKKNTLMRLRPAKEGMSWSSPGTGGQKTIGRQRAARASLLSSSCPLVIAIQRWDVRTVDAVSRAKSKARVQYVGSRKAWLRAGGGGASNDEGYVAYRAAWPFIDLLARKTALLMSIRLVSSGLGRRRSIRMYRSYELCPLVSAAAHAVIKHPTRPSVTYAAHPVPFWRRYASSSLTSPTSSPLLPPCVPDFPCCSGPKAEGDGEMNNSG